MGLVAPLAHDFAIVEWIKPEPFLAHRTHQQPVYLHLPLRHQRLDPVEGLRKPGLHTLRQLVHGLFRPVMGSNLLPGLFQGCHIHESGRMYPLLRIDVIHPATSFVLKRLFLLSHSETR